MRLATCIRAGVVCYKNSCTGLNDKAVYDQLMTLFVVICIIRTVYVAILTDTHIHFEGWSQDCSKSDGCFSQYLISSPWRRYDYNISFYKQWKFRCPLLVWAMAPKFALFTKGSKLPLNKGFKNMFELLQSWAQPSNFVGCPAYSALDKRAIPLISPLEASGRQSG